MNDGGKMDTRTEKSESLLHLPGTSGKMMRFWQTIIRHKKAYLVITLAVLAAISVTSFGVRSTSPSYAFTSKCTLNILSGSVDISVPGSIEVQPGTDGMTLDAGDRVKTSPDSAVLLTFFDGSTITLEPDTDIEIEQIDLTDNQQTINIILKQWTGKTWSHVVKMADRRYHYEVKTPSAVALVRGTQFLTEVDEAGTTTVLTAEGLVSVSAQGTEVFLPVGEQTTVEQGTPPSEPTSVDISEYVKAQEYLLKGELHHQSKSANNASNHNPDTGNQQNNAADKQTADSSADNQGSSDSKNNGNAGSPPVPGNQKQNNGQTGADNGNGNALGQSQDNGNGNGNGNGNASANANGNGNGNALGQSQDNGNGNGNANASANGNGNGNALGQSQDNGNSNGNANASANGNGNGNNNNASTDENGNGNASGQGQANAGNGNGNNQNQDNKGNQDKAAVPPTPTPTPAPPDKPDKDKPDKDK
jgi:hypothetical protein